MPRQTLAGWLGVAASVDQTDHDAPYGPGEDQDEERKIVDARDEYAEGEGHHEQSGERDVGDERSAVHRVVGRLTFGVAIDRLGHPGQHGRSEGHRADV